MASPITVKDQVFVERDFLAKTPADQLTNFMQKIMVEGNKLRIIDNINQFFSNMNAMDCIEKANIDDLKLIAAKRGIDIKDTQYDTILAFAQLKKDVKEQFNAGTKGYKFVEVPKNYNPEKAYNISGASVRRNGYDITLKTLEKIWLKVSVFWNSLGEEEEKTFKYPSYISADGYSRVPKATATYLEIGCQTIQRYELEQFALGRGWAFPN